MASLSAHLQLCFHEAHQGVAGLAKLRPALVGEEFVGVLHEARPTRGFGAVEIDGQRSFQLPTLGSHGLAMDMDLHPFTACGTVPSCRSKAKRFTIPHDTRLERILVSLSVHSPTRYLSNTSEARSRAHVRTAQRLDTGLLRRGRNHDPIEVSIHQARRTGFIAPPHAIGLKKAFLRAPRGSHIGIHQLGSLGRLHHLNRSRSEAVQKPPGLAINACECRLSTCAFHVSVADPHGISTLQARHARLLT